MSHTPKGADGKDGERTRAELFEARGVQTAMPTAPAYLVGWLQELGWCSAGAMGPVALPATEVAAWAQGTGRRLQGWEFAALKDASRCFVQGLRDETPTPPDQEQNDKPATPSGFASMFKKLNKTDNPDR